MTEPTNTPDQPTGAIVNGREFARRLEANYDFQDLAGPLVRCTDWDELKACFEHLAAYCKHRPQPATASPVKPLGYVNVYRDDDGDLVLGACDLDATPDEPMHAAEFCEVVGKGVVVLLDDLSAIQPEAPSKVD